jgi:hypothetical protein
MLPIFSPMSFVLLPCLQDSSQIPADCQTDHRLPESVSVSPEAEYTDTVVMTPADSEGSQAICLLTLLSVCVYLLFAFEFA